MEPVTVVALRTGPGYAPAQNSIVESDTAPATMTPYKIPPAVWMILFLVVGYVGLRLLMED